MTPETVLELSGITKRFGDLVANRDISFSLSRGEVLALLGENGAGKSTLMSILFGHYTADSGTVTVEGQVLPPGRPAAAIAAGVGMVHQHFTLAENLTVLDNVMIGTEPMLAPWSRRRDARVRLADLAVRFGLAVDPDAPVRSLSVGEKQRVEILKAMYRGARILILDEPTSVLTPQEAARLFVTLGQMVADGLSIVFISHKLDEVLAVSSRIVILRRGEKVAELPVAGASREQLAHLMVGRRIEMPVRTAAHDIAAEPLLELRDVNAPAPHGGRGLVGATLAVRGGEIVAIAGVAGNGQDVLAELLAGERVPAAGTIRCGGRPFGTTPRTVLASGVGRIPEDRQGTGAIGELPLWENTILETYAGPRFARFGVRRRAAALRHARMLVERFDVRAASIEMPASRLSGGNMQKLILGRVLGESPRVVIANQPTWGLDVGAVAYVHEQILAARARGAAVLVVSEDLDEVFALADRIAVIHAGELSAARPAAQWDTASIGLAMAGAAGP